MQLMPTNTLVYTDTGSWIDDIGCLQVRDGSRVMWSDWQGVCHASPESAIASNYAVRERDNNSRFSNADELDYSYITADWIRQNFAIAYRKLGSSPNHEDDWSFVTLR